MKNNKTVRRETTRNTVEASLYHMICFLVKDKFVGGGECMMDGHFWSKTKMDRKGVVFVHVNHSIIVD